MQKFNITIDGGSGVGKGAISKHLSKHFNFQTIDSGAIYRTIALKAHENNVEHPSEEFLQQFQFSQENNILKVNNEVVEDLPIRTPENSKRVSIYATQKLVREHVTKQQQNILEDKGFVLDGRDAGTVVCPNAEIKLYIECPMEIRALRRLQDFKKQGILYTLEEVIKDFEERDHRDMNRDLDPLTVPKNAFIFTNDNSKSFEDLMSDLIYLIESKMK